MLHPQKLGLIPIFIGGCTKSRAHVICQCQKDSGNGSTAPPRKAKRMKKSIIVATAMLAMNPLGYQAPQETTHNPDNSIAMSTAKNKSQRILCTLFPCKLWWW